MLGDDAAVLPDQALRNVQVAKRAAARLTAGTHDGREYLIVATVRRRAESAAATDLPQLIQRPRLPDGFLDLYVTSQAFRRTAAGFPTPARTIRGIRVAQPSTAAVMSRRTKGVATRLVHLPRGPDGRREDRTQRGWHPLLAERLGVWRFSGFELTRLPAPPDVHLFRIRGREVPDDQRLVVLADVRELTIVRDDAGRITGLPQLERILDACLDSLRSARSADRELARLDWNRIKLYVWPTVEAPLAELGPVIRSLAARTGALGLEQVMVQFRDADSRERMLRMSRPPGAGLTLQVTDPPPGPLRELTPYTQNVIRARRRGTVYPYELIPLITRSPDPAAGRRVHRVRPDEGVPRCRWTGRRVPIRRTWCSAWSARRRAYTGDAPGGAVGDPTRALGALAEAECRRILAAIDRRGGCGPDRVVRHLGLAKIAMDSAPRPWTGSPGRCAGSSSSRRLLARSTWW
jgi:hypothetical protein